MDLGLPSGTLWAIMNVGASNPSEYGLYFQWGDTSGYTADQVGEGEGQKAFKENDYKWYLSGTLQEDNLKLKKYTIHNAILDLEDDAANVHMGGNWHMPTPKQCQELIDNTTTAWTTSNDGVKGMKFTSKKDMSKFIFIPAAGYVYYGLVDEIGYSGSIWSSSTSDKGVDGSLSLGCFSAEPFLFDDSRINGFPVRGVIG